MNRRRSTEHLAVPRAARRGGGSEHVREALAASGLPVDYRCIVYRAPERGGEMPRAREARIELAHCALDRPRTFDLEARFAQREAPGAPRAQVISGRENSPIAQGGS